MVLHRERLVSVFAVGSLFSGVGSVSMSVAYSECFHFGSTLACIWPWNSHSPNELSFSVVGLTLLFDFFYL